MSYRQTDFILLADNDLGDNIIKGSKLVVEKNLVNHSYILTDGYEIPEVVSFCNKHQLNLIPKSIQPKFHVEKGISIEKR